MCGQHVREAMPDGGKVMIAIGSIEKENGHRRRQGVIDELLERSFEPNRPADPVDAPIKGPKYTIVATLIDNIDPQRATELAADAMKKHPDVGCFVGLFASSTPAVLKALEQAGKLGQVKVVGFDANEETLEGIENGYVYATIVQDAYNIGYQAVRILADAAEGDPNAIPLYPTFHLRCDEIDEGQPGGDAAGDGQPEQARAARRPRPRRDAAGAATTPAAAAGRAAHCRFAQSPQRSISVAAVAANRAAMRRAPLTAHSRHPTIHPDERMDAARAVAVPGVRP